MRTRIDHLLCRLLLGLLEMTPLRGLHLSVRGGRVVADTEPPAHVREAEAEREAARLHALEQHRRKRDLVRHAEHLIAQQQAEDA